MNSGTTGLMAGIYSADEPKQGTTKNFKTGL
jgi:hypothetical protein